MRVHANRYAGTSRSYGAIGKRRLYDSPLPSELPLNPS